MCAVLVAEWIGGCEVWVVVCVGGGASGLRKVGLKAEWRPAWVNCSAGSVCWWCEWDANWVVVRSRGDTVVARADLR